MNSTRSDFFRDKEFRVAMIKTEIEGDKLWWEVEVMKKKLDEAINSSEEVLKMFNETL